MTKKIVYAPGAWDLFHIGHVNLLRRAKEMAKILIVGVDTDESIKAFKGRYPVIPYRERVAVIQACRWVDKTVRNKNGCVNVNQLLRLRIDVVVLGRDEDWRWQTLVGYTEAKRVLGIEFVRIPYTNKISSTEIKKRIIEELK